MLKIYANVQCQPISPILKNKIQAKIPQTLPRNRHDLCLDLVTAWTARQLEGEGRRPWSDPDLRTTAHKRRRKLLTYWQWHIL